LSTPPSAVRSRLVFLAKAALAVALVVWLVESGNLDMRAMRIYVERPLLLLLDLALFWLGVVIATLRFGVLLGLAEVRVPFVTLFRLQMTAIFFNVVIPGNIGGDVVKALYVAREEPKEKRTTIVLVAFVERLIGVSALVILGALVTLARPSIWADAVLRPLALAVTAIGAVTLFGGALAIAAVRKAGAHLDRFTSGPSKLSKLLNQLVLSMRLVSAGPRRLVVALLLSMSFHGMLMAFFTLLTQALIRQDVSYSAVAALFPLGLLSLMLPISPSGFGVGHVAFKRLFEAIGLSGGATVFNVYLLGQILPCLIGVFWFLSLKRKGELPAELPEAAPPAR
jgi:uncharacterized protein (TIRG00374 family)